MNRFLTSITLFLSTILIAQGFISPQARLPHPRVKPVFENFFLDIAEDPAINTPSEILGEVRYKNFVGEYEPDALLLGGSKYDIIGRVRELKLLSTTADVGLLEALEAKGLTLSKLEKILPLIDDLGLLPLLVNNKELVLSVAPLLIEPAPALLPVLVSVLKTSSETFTIPGATLVGLGVYESLDNQLLGLLLALLGAPLLALGSVLSGSISLPSPTPVSSNPSYSELAQSSSASSEGVSVASIGSTVVAKGSSSEQVKGPRKVIKIRA